MDLDHRCPLSVEDLPRYAAEYLAHEIQMFRATGALLAGPPPASVGEWATEIALIESLLLHSRVLLNFLYPEHVRRDDIIANDFVAGPPSWTAVVPRRGPALRDLRRAGQTSHLTTSRLSDRPIRRAHAQTIYAELDVVLRRFASHAGDDRLGPDVRKLIRSRATSRTWMRPAPQRAPGATRCDPVGDPVRSHRRGVGSRASGGRAAERGVLSWPR